MKALILAAGYGTRLYPLTLNIPKALLKIGKKYLIDFLIDKLKVLGLKDIIVVTNNRFYSNFLEWSKIYPFPIEIINDNTKNPQERLGAIGDIEFVISKKNIKEDLLVLGSDNLFTWSLKGFLEYASSLGQAVVGLYNVEDFHRAKRLGIAIVDKEGKITNFLEKPHNPPTTLAGTCIYFFPEASLSLIKEYLLINRDKDTTGQYISWLREQINVYGYVFDGKWLDIGHKDTLEEAKKIFS